MEHEYNHDDIEAYIRRANQMRSEALGQMLVAGWNAGKRLCAQVVRGHTTANAAAKSTAMHGLAH